MAAVTPMELVAKGDQSPIPLRCTLCPTKPNFSDLSHLLTHMASKSHLSHKFKVELRSKNDREAYENFRQYNDWYHRYDIDSLLAERIIAKDQKKSGRRGRSATTAGIKRETSADGKQDDSIKAEPEDNFEPSEPPLMLAPWPPASIPSYNGRQGYLDDSSYQTPNLKRSRSDASSPNPHENPLHLHYGRLPSEAETAESAPASELTSLPSEVTDPPEDENENDTSKLKGIRYPGMGLFDAADEDQKKRRNQRKDDSVLKQMEEISSGIEPTECVWTEIGEFQRSRDIYATPSIEGSPDRTLEPQEEPDAVRPKRRRRSAAAPAQQRQTRSSARITRRNELRQQKVHTEDDLSEQVDIDDSIQTQNSVDSHDIFRDPPNPHLGWAETAQEKASFNLGRPSALQSRNPNLSMASSTPKAVKSTSFFPTRETTGVSFAHQPPIPASHYFQHQHAMGGGNANPLCAQNRNGFFNPYGYPIHSNAMNLGSMHFNPFGASYGTDSAHDRGDDDFEL